MTKKKQYLIRKKILLIEDDEKGIGFHDDDYGVQPLDDSV
jgi:hypothetical protein